MSPQFTVEGLAERECLQMRLSQLGLVSSRMFSDAMSVPCLWTWVRKRSFSGLGIVDVAKSTVLKSRMKICSKDDRTKQADQNEEQHYFLSFDCFKLLLGKRQRLWCTAWAHMRLVARKTDVGLNTAHANSTTTYNLELTLVSNATVVIIIITRVYQWRTGPLATATFVFVCVFSP